MVKAYLRGRQIFKFGLLIKKDNMKNLKIRLVSNRMLVAFFPPYYSYTNQLAFIEKKTLQMKKNLPLILIIVSIILIIVNFIFTSDEMDIGFWLRI
jgi:hypothetical protein